jgi:hypothetical protein
MHYPYSEVISTRKVKSEEGPLFPGHEMWKFDAAARDPHSNRSGP